MNELKKRIVPANVPEVNELETAFNEFKDLNEPFLALREQYGWITIETDELIAATQLPDDGGRWYLKPV